MQTYRVRTKQGRITIRVIQVPEREQLIVHFSKKTKDSQIRNELRAINFSFERNGENWYAHLTSKRLANTEKAIKAYIKRAAV